MPSPGGVEFGGVVRPILDGVKGPGWRPSGEAGVPIHEVRDALGHSSTTMTSTYLRTRVNSLTKAYKQRAAHQARQRIKRVV